MQFDKNCVHGLVNSAYHVVGTARAMRLCGDCSIAQWSELFVGHPDISALRKEVDVILKLLNLSTLK